MTTLQLNKDERKRAKVAARLQTVLDFYDRFGEENESVNCDNKNGPHLKKNLLEKTRSKGWDRTTDVSFRAVMMIWPDLGRIQPGSFREPT